MALYRGAIIQSLITAPLAAYLLPGDSLFKPLPNDLGKLTCSTSQGCGAPLMSEGVAPMQGLLVLPKKKREARKGPATATNASHIQTLRTSPTSFLSSCRWLTQAQHAEGLRRRTWSLWLKWAHKLYSSNMLSASIWTLTPWWFSFLCWWKEIQSYIATLKWRQRKSSKRKVNQVTQFKKL